MFHRLRNCRILRLATRNPAPFALPLDTEPETHRGLHLAELLRTQLAKPAHKLRKWNRDQVLRIERTFAQKSCPNGHLVGRTPNCSRMRDQCHKSTVIIARSPAENQSRPHLRGKTQIHLPDLASGQPFGRRSSSRSI